MFGDEPVKITPKAIHEIKKIMKTKKIPSDYGLRIGVKGGMGCGNVNFILGFDKDSDKDVLINIDGIPVYIEKGQMLFLIGITVDFYEGADARGFSFIKEDVTNS